MSSSIVTAGDGAEVGAELGAAEVGAAEVGAAEVGPEVGEEVSTAFARTSN